eukprot:1184087-Prorocentrum_minimum.AAC.4
MGVLVGAVVFHPSELGGGPEDLVEGDLLDVREAHRLRQWEAEELARNGGKLLAVPAERGGGEVEDEDVLVGAAQPLEHVLVRLGHGVVRLVHNEHAHIHLAGALLPLHLLQQGLRTRVAT